jgi:hypothetical protein
MIRWLFQKPLVTVLCLLGIFVFAWMYRVVNLALDTRAVMNLEELPTRIPYLPAWVKPFNPSDATRNEISRFLNYGAGVFRSPDFWDGREELVDFVRGTSEIQLLGAGLNTSSGGLLTTLPDQTRALKTAPFAADRLDYQGIRGIGHFFLVWGMAQLYQGATSEAVNSFLALFLLARELDYPEKGGFSLIGRMTGSALRDYGWRGLLSVVRHSCLSRQEMSRLNRFLEMLDGDSSPFQAVLLLERNFTAHLAEFILTEHPAHFTPGNRRIPYSLARYARHSEFLEQRRRELVDPIVAAGAVDYGTACPIVDEAMQKVEKGQRDISRLTPAKCIDLVFSPQRLFLEAFLIIHLPNFGRVFQREGMLRQMNHGIRTALLLKAYHQVFHEYPSTLREAYDWIDAVPPNGAGPMACPLTYTPDKTVILTAPGKDGKPGTMDDLHFLPYEFFPSY